MRYRKRRNAGNAALGLRGSLSLSHHCLLWQFIAHDDMTQCLPSESWKVESGNRNSEIP